MYKPLIVTDAVKIFWVTADADAILSDLLYRKLKLEEEIRRERWSVARCSPPATGPPAKVGRRTSHAPPSIVTSYSCRCVWIDVIIRCIKREKLNANDNEIGASMIKLSCTSKKLDWGWEHRAQQMKLIHRRWVHVKITRPFNLSI